MRHRQAIAVLALVGFFVSLYLWLYKIGAIGQLQCGAGSCEYVQSSTFAVLFGVPVAFYGVAGYALILAVALVGLRPAYLAQAWPARLLVTLAAGGFLFTLYLTYVELFVINALCRWCVASALIITAITVVALAALRRGT